MNRYSVLSLVCLALVLCTSCQSSILDRADNTLDKATKVVQEVKTDVKESISEIKKQYEDALKATKESIGEVRADLSQDVEKVKEDIRKQIDDLDQKFQDRIDQAKNSASELIKQGDAAVQARIDQVFAEVRGLVKDVLAQLKELIQPVLALATEASTSFDIVAGSVVKITESTEKLLTSVTTTVSEAKNLILSFQGKNPDGTKTSFDFGALGLSALALVKSLFTDKKRSDEKKDQGDRWKSSELRQEAWSEFVERISTGQADELIRARMAVLMKTSEGPTKSA